MRHQYQLQRPSGKLSAVCGSILNAGQCCSYLVFNWMDYITRGIKETCIAMQILLLQKICIIYDTKEIQLMNL